MKDFRLEVTDINVDVIATSCSNANLIYYYEPKCQYTVYMNGGDVLNGDEATAFLKNEDYCTEDGYYHCDKNGNIYEKCSTWDENADPISNGNEIKNKHHISNW